MQPAACLTAACIAATYRLFASAPRGPAGTVSGAWSPSKAPALHVAVHCPACSWNLQTAAARQEIARTHKALTDIQANISKVRLSVAAEDVAFQVAAEAAQLEQRLEQQVQDLLRRLGQREQQLQGLLQERQQDEQQTKVSNKHDEVLPAQAASTTMKLFVRSS